MLNVQKYVSFPNLGLPFSLQKSGPNICYQMWVVSRQQYVQTACHSRTDNSGQQVITAAATEEVLTFLFSGSCMQRELEK